MTHLIKESCKIISKIFNPLLLNTYLFLLLFLSSALDLGMFQNIKAIGFILSIIFLITAVLPYISIIIIKQFNLGKKEQNRKSLSLLFTSLYYIICFYIFRNSKNLISNDMLLIMSILTLSSLIFTGVNLFFRISIHATVSACLMGVLMVLSLKTDSQIFFYSYIFSILLTGLLMSIRLYIKNYDKANVYLSAILGVVTSGVPLYYWL